MAFAGHQTSPGDQCCDDSDPRSNNCSGGHSVPKQSAAMEIVRNITETDDAVSDDEDEIGPPISLNKYTNEELSQKQKDNPELHKLFKWTKGKFPSDREEMFAESPALKHFWLTKENLSLSNNCLYYRWTFPEETRLIFIVPEAMKKEVIDIAHCSPLSGHPGIKRTIQHLRQTFYWFDMTDWVTTFVGACEKCALSKKPNKTNRSSLQQYQAGSPMDRIQQDILGPFPLSKKGNKYILVLVDSFRNGRSVIHLPTRQQRLLPMY
jgi:hypothetical protein